MRHYNHKRVIGSWKEVSINLIRVNDFFRVNDFYQTLKNEHGYGRFYWPSFLIQKTSVHCVNKDSNLSEVLTHIFFEDKRDALYVRLKYG